MRPRTALLVVDPQNDFCDLPPAWCPNDPAVGEPHRPALPVAGAHADMQRLGRFIETTADRLDAVTVTLDSHHRVGIERPAFWTRDDGQPVAAFTQITAADVRAGHYAPKDPTLAARVLDYLDALEAAGRYRLMVWPAHCEIGTWGHNVHADVARACGIWEEGRLGAVEYIIKGTNPMTEHYSAIMAEVPNDDPTTCANERLLARMLDCDRLIVAGEASSHCVRATTEHIMQLGAGRLPQLVLLSDCMSPVAGFDAACQAFFDAMRASGARVDAAATVAAELQ